MRVNKDKILHLESLKPWIDYYKGQGLTIVSASGCFDAVIHCGHISYLEYASQLGDILIVGLNDDESITQLKGPTRPIHNEECRARVLCSLECIDNLVICNNTADFLNKVKPDFWVKDNFGYSLETVNKKEKDTVLSNGGQIVFAPRIYEISTTKILEKLNGN